MDIARERGTQRRDRHFQIATQEDASRPAEPNRPGACPSAPFHEGESAESAGDRHSSQLPKSGSGVVSGTCVGMAGFFLFFPTFSQIFYFLTNVLSRKWMGLKRRFDERPKFLGKHWNDGTLPP